MTNKKRILFITDNLDLGGAQSFVMYVFNNIDKSKCDIDFVVSSPDRGFYEDEIEKQGSNVFHLCSPKRIIKYKKLFKKILKEKQYDVVHCHINFLSYTPLSCCNKNMIRVCHSHASYPSSGLASKIFRYFFKKWISKHCDYLLGCSEVACKWLYGNNKYEIIENEIDNKRFSFNLQKREEVRKCLNISDNSFVFVNVGNLEPVKRQIELIESFQLAKEQIDNIVLLIIGGGSQKETLELEISRLKLNNCVYLLGRKVDVENYLSASDCFVLSSLFEGSPISLIEAHANGIPCLASNTLKLSNSLRNYVVSIDVEDKNIFASELVSATKLKRQTNNYDLQQKSIKRLEEIFLIK